MKKYDVTLTGRYEKSIIVYAKTPAHAREKIETVLFDTDLIDFTDADFVSGKVLISDPHKKVSYEQQSENEYSETDTCSDCDFFCPVCGECMCEEEM